MLPPSARFGHPRSAGRATLIALVLIAANLATGLASFAILAGAEHGTPLDVNRDGLVVIAVVDTGINPYHSDFSAASYVGPADLTRDPASYLTGYPSPHGDPIQLSLNEVTYAEAVEKDRATWKRLEAQHLYWFPGTKIVGAYDSDGTTGLGSTPDNVRILDEDGHGTKSASVAVGNAYGSCPECLLVVVEGFAGLRWALAQPWIDIVSNSWGSLGNVGIPVSALTGDHTFTRAAAERGQTVLFASGNGVENSFITPEQTYAPETNGPDWVVNVGGSVPVDNASSRHIVGTGHPVDVIAQAMDVPAAHPFNLTGMSFHSGTSAATPRVAGVMGHVIAKARAVLDAPENGQFSRGVIAKGTPVPGSMILGDGRFTRAELWDVVFKTAAHTYYGGVGIYPMSVTSNAATDIFFEGYGVVDRATRDRAVNVTLGTEGPIYRPDEDFFFSVDATIRDGIWGAWDRDGDGTRERATPHI